jgi:hypothetical protein
MKNLISALCFLSLSFFVHAEEASSLLKDTTIGGYGEINYNHYDKEPSRNQADLRRFVLFLGHRFDDHLSFNSEVEWEHAVVSDEDKGETEIEQAYLNYAFSNGLNLKAGVILMPFGFLNLSHEPPVFYGVERNEVETRIIPSTWREGGIGFYGTTEAGFGWDVGVTTGFDIAKFDDPSSPLGSVHQEMQKAKATDLSAYAAASYRGVPGLNLGGAVFSGNSTQGNADFNDKATAQPDFSGISARITLWEVHARWESQGWDLETLWAQGIIDQAGKIDQAIQAFNAAGNEKSFVPSEFTGWLAQAAYTVWRKNETTLAPFVRFEDYNTQSKMPSGFSADPANADRVVTAGLSFKPRQEVAFKMDYQRYTDNSKNNRFNIGMGYMF